MNILSYNQGISRSGSMLDMGVDIGVIGKSGAYFSYGDIRLGQGRENARAFLEDNEPLMDEIEGKIRSNGLDVAVVAVAAGTDDDD